MYIYIYLNIYMYIYIYIYMYMYILTYNITQNSKKHYNIISIRAFPKIQDPIIAP